MTAVRPANRALPPEVEFLRPLVDRSVLDLAAVHATAAFVRQVRGEPEVFLAYALVLQALEGGHVGLRPDEVEDHLGLEPGLLPDPVRWEQLLRSSDLVAAAAEAHQEPRRPLVWDQDRLYLQRYWDYERAVAADLRRRCAAPLDDLTTASGTDELLTRLFPPQPDASETLQRRAVEVALSGALTIVCGGPGTGKTYTLARLLVALHQLSPLGDQLQVALAAPTGKAAARMTEAVRDSLAAVSGPGTIDQDAAQPMLPFDQPQSSGMLGELEATTIHRLLGTLPDNTFRHHAGNPLPHDVLIIDETSMVPLPLMARLLDAIRPDARLVLVGDPHQLVSVDAGSVLADLVADRADPGSLLGARTVELTHSRRFRPGSGIAALANAIRAGDADGAIAAFDAAVPVAGGRPDIRLLSATSPDANEVLAEAAADGAAMVTAAAAGEVPKALAHLTATKVLTARRQGRGGLAEWTTRLERAVADRLGRHSLGRGWYVGRPVLVSVNDPGNRLANGDTGVVIDTEDGLQLALDDGGEHRQVPVARLSETEPFWAMTIHKSQGSEFPHVVVSLPAEPSPFLTRELLYTAVTRAKVRCTVIATEEVVARAVQAEVRRASGLRDRLRAATGVSA